MGGPLAQELTQAGLATRVMGRRAGFDWRLILRFYRLFRRERPDIVQTHHLTQLVYAGPAARLAGARLVHVEHEFFSLMNPADMRLLRILGRFCHRIVAVGTEVKTFLVERVGLDSNQVDVIHNGIDLTRYAVAPRRSRVTLGLAPDATLIGHVARLEADKDQETLLSAFRMVHAVRPECRLVMVGDGTLRDRLSDVAARLGVRPYVDFLGVRRDVSDLLPHITVFALSSVREGLPVALLEAMACGITVVATAVGEVPRVIENGVSGRTVPPRDPQALAEAILAGLDDSAKQRLGAAARRTIEHEFDLAATIQQYRTLYEALLLRTTR